MGILLLQFSLLKILSSLNGGAYGFIKISLSLLYPNIGLIKYYKNII